MQQPTGRRANREVHTDDMPVGQMPEINLDDRLVNHESETIEPIQAFVSSKYVEDLAFMEEAVSIRLERSTERFAPTVVECWVNGKGCEVFQNGKWMSFGYFPVGQVVITKRKYVESLARAKQDAVQTTVLRRDGEDPNNYVQRFTSVKHPFSIIQDRSANGADWLTRLMAEG